MLKTLHGYLTRDLLRATLQSLVAFTLMMTVLAVIQPLRKLGLAGEQLLWFFVYTMPVMLSFTLPVATLFAATLVYGRFSQDNELLAARASGISTLSLLRPALVLGAIVTAISLTLSNFIAPDLTTMAGLVQANAREIAYHRLRTQGFLEFGQEGRRHVIYADGIDAVNDTLKGVVYVFRRDPKPSKDPNRPAKGGGAFLASAASANLDFVKDAEGNPHVIVEPKFPSVIRIGENVGLAIAPEAESFRWVRRLDNPIERKPSWYTWPELLQTLRDPQKHDEVQRRLKTIKESICNDLLAEEIVAAIGRGEPYTQFAKGDESYEIRAASATKDAEGSAILSSTTADGAEGRPVAVIVRRGRREIKEVTASSGRVVVAPDQLTRKPMVTVRLTGNVATNVFEFEGVRQLRQAEWSLGEVAVPAGIRERADDIEMSALLTDPERFSRNEKIRYQIDVLKTERIPKLKSALIAELHGRVAYGASCFLMVAMGAALGLMFKGGQFISAFAISAVPAAIVIAMLLMGKGMVRNPDVEMHLGLMCIWAGIVVLLGATLLIYWRLSRR